MSRILRLLLGVSTLIGTAQAATTTTDLEVTVNGNGVTSVSTGTVVTLTATVRAGSRIIAPGQVKFCDADAPHCTDIHVLGMAQLTSAGTATLRFVPSAGAHLYQAVFLGTNTYAPSVSGVTGVGVTGIAPTGVATASLAVSGVAGNYTLTATLSGSSATGPTGSVSFQDTSNNNYPLGSASLQVGPTGLTFKPKPALTTGRYPSTVVTADFNGDGIPDIAVANAGLVTNVPGSLSIYLGKGDGTFAPPLTTVTGDFPGGLLVSDFNGDGKLDLALTTSLGTINILLGNGDGTFTAGQSIPGAFSSFAAAVGDVNGDGNQDIIGISQFSSTIFILIGNGDGTFTLLPQTAATGDNPVQVAVGDFNGDGKLDLIVDNIFAGNGSLAPAPLTVLLGRGDGTFTAAPSPTVGVGPEGLAVADFDGDGNLDIAVVNIQPRASIMVLLGKGDGTFGTPISTGNVDYINGITVTDLNGDGKPDLVAWLAETVPPITYNVLALLGIGDGTFNNTVGAASSGIGNTGTVADLNGDGLPDIAALNQAQDVSIFLTGWTGSSTATISNVSPIGLGTHYADATYSGDASYAAVTSAKQPLQGVLVPTGLALAASPASGIAGQAVMLTANLTPYAEQGHAATGTVTFYNNGIGIGNGQISNGVATLGGFVPPLGTNSLTAVYTGDNDFATSTSPAVPYDVKSSALIEPVGTTSPVQTATVYSPAAFLPIASIVALTQGTQGLDFNLAPGGTCTIGATYPSGSSCTVNFTFTPQRPGVRIGAIQLRSSSGMPVGTAFVQGTGTGPQVNYSPGSLKTLPITLANGSNSRISMAVDAAGSLYFAIAVSAGSPGNVVVKETPDGKGGYAQTYVVQGLYYPVGIAVDGAGNVFEADQDNEAIYEQTPVNGVYMNTKVFGPIGVLSGVAVDGSGTLYIASELLGLLQATYTGAPGGYSGYTVIDPHGGNYPIAIDGNGVIYSSNGTTYTPQSNGTYMQGSFPGGLQLAIDDQGNVFSATQFRTTLYKYIPSAGSYQSALLGTFASTVQGVAADGNGNVFFTVNGAVMELDFADPPSLSFANTDINTTSSDSPKSATIFNQGNEPLVFTAPGNSASVNPVIASGFAIGGNSTCPQAVTPTTPFSLAAGASCTYGVNFHPIAPGTDNGELAFTDNNLNVATAFQVIPLNGTGNGTPTRVTSISPNSGPAAGGSYVIISGGPFVGVLAVRFGSAVASSFTVNASGTAIDVISPPGTGTVDVTVQTSVGVTSTSPADQFTYVGHSQAQTITFPVPTQPAYVGTSVLLTATGGASGNPVVFSVVSGPAMVSGTNGSTLTYTGPGTVVVEADQAAGAGYPAAAPVQVSLSPFVLTVPVGSTSVPIATLATFQTAGTLASTRSSIGGLAGQDFTLASGGSCNSATSYTAGQTCLMQFLFAPTHPGQRRGGVVFTNASASTMATTYFYGVGSGPQVTFSPAAQIALPGSLVQPDGIAVDGAGNIFVATEGSGLYEIPVSGPPVQIGSFASAQDVSVDGVGNVFVANDQTTVSEILAVNGTIPAAPTIVTISSQFHALTSIKVDGLGNLYLSDAGGAGGSGFVYKVLSVNGAIPASPTVQVLSTAFPGPTGVAVDSDGNLYISDDVNNGAYEVMAVNGSIPASPTISTLATGILRPSNIALDAAGDVFLSVYGQSDVAEIVAVNGSIPATPTILSLGSGLATPQGLFVDPSGNVFVADSGLTYAVELNYAAAPTLTFAPTIIGQTSSDSPQSVSFTNDGNAPLTLPSPSAGFNPGTTPGFETVAGSTCPRLSPGNASYQLSPGSSCTDEVSFSPLTAGNITGQLVVTDNALNVTGATQIVPLNATGLNLVIPTLTLSVPNQTLGTPPITVAAVSNSPGAITYAVVSGPATIAGSSVTCTGAGTVQLLASQAASGIYAAATATATFNVYKEAQTITFAPLATPIPLGAPPISLVATATSALPVTFTVVSGPATVSGAILTVTGAGTIVVAANQAGNAQYAAAPTATQTVMVDPQPQVTLTATPNPVFLNNPVTLTAALTFTGPQPSGTVTFLDGINPIGTAALTGQTATINVSNLTLGTHSITASYGGNANYASAVSAPVAVTVEDFQLALSNPNVTIDHGGTATLTLSLAASSAAGMASTVNLAATGFPIGSQVGFTPASVPSGSGTTPVTLVIQTPNYPSGPWQLGSMRRGTGGTALSGLLIAGGLLLPLGLYGRRTKTILRSLALACLSAGLLAGLSGCGSGWKTQVWTIGITATSGQLSHSVTATITSECKDGQPACPIVAP